MNGSEPYNPAGIGRATKRGYLPCAVQWILSPHPSPLPWGEGDPCSLRRISQSRWHSTARCALFPLPGERVSVRGNGANYLSRIGPFPESSNEASPPAAPEVSQNDYEDTFSMPCSHKCASIETEILLPLFHDLQAVPYIGSPNHSIMNCGNQKPLAKANAAPRQIKITYARVERRRPR